MPSSSLPPVDLQFDPVSLHGLFGTASRLDLANIEIAAWGEMCPWLALAREAGIPVAVCEAAVGRDLPTYPERRLWRAALPCPFRGGILVFTDSARLSFVWSWAEWGEVGCGRYVEHRLPGREATLERGLRSWADGRPRASPPVANKEVWAMELLGVLRRRCPPIPANAVLSQSAFQGYVEECDDLEELRKIWRAVRRIRALDLDSPDPDWLLSVGRALEAVLLALIERMRVWLDEQTVAPRRRPEYLRDFRHVVEQAEGPRWDFDRRRFIRRLVAQQHLFAATRPGPPHDRRRASLFDFAGVDDPSVELLACNVCDSQLIPPRLPVTRPANTPRSPPTTGASAYEIEVEILRRAWSAVRSVALLENGASDEVARAARQIDLRRSDLLGRKQDGREAGSAGPEGGWPLLFPGVVGWNDFDLVHAS